AHACGEPNARPFASAARNFGAIDAVPVLVGKDHQIRLLQDHPDVVPSHLVACAPTKTLIARDDLLAELARKAIRAAPSNSSRARPSSCCFSVATRSNSSRSRPT